MIIISNSRYNISNALAYTKSSAFNGETRKVIVCGTQTQVFFKSTQKVSMLKATAATKIQHMREGGGHALAYF